MPELSDLTVADASARIRERELSPMELMEALLPRAVEMDANLQVWVTLDPDAALAEARKSERELAEKGPRGPLHGIPIGVKDIYYTAGVKTTAGSPIYAGFVPDHDATTVARLKRAGAIIMGKTVTTEFACMDPPLTRNPWNPAHTPGGSSSGSAVGVAVRMFPAALGSQTAGSVLRPASYNGVVGLKPTFGRISRYGVMPVAWSLDTMGAFTRTVDDAALILGVLAGHDDRDASSSTRPVPDYREAVSSRQGPPRIGVVRQFFYDRSTDEVRANAGTVLERLEEAGAVVEEVNVRTDLDTLLSAHRIVMASEAAAVHQRDFDERPDDYGPNVRGLVESGMLTPAVAYLQAQRIRRMFRSEMVGAVRRYDVFLTPSTQSPAPRDLTTTGDPMFQSPWTTCGFPAITIPSGLGASGLPLGIQLVSAPFDEETLLAVARWCERLLDTNLRPPYPA